MTRASGDEKPAEKDSKKAQEGARQKLTVGVPEETVQNFDDLLEICGEAGAWQLKVFLLASFCGITTVFHNLVYAFLGAIPDHWCHLPPSSAFPGYSSNELKNLTIPRDGKGKFSQCDRYWVDGDWDTGAFSINSINRSVTVSCSAIDFDQSIFKTTIPQEWSLVCGDEFWASLVQATYMVGNLLGSSIFGALSDKVGRKRTLLIATISFLIFAPAVALAPNFTTLMICRFILGATNPGIYTTSFVLVVETVGIGWRGLAGNLFCVPFAFGYMMLPGFAYVFREWRHLQLVLSAPGILLLVTWWFLPESPRWLLRKGRVDEADQVLRKVAQVNGNESTLPDNFKDLIARIAAVEKEDVKASTFCEKTKEFLGGYVRLLRTPRIRSITLIIYLSWMSISMIYYGIALNSPNLSTDKYLYTFLGGVMEIPSYFMVPPLIKYLGRRPVFSGFVIITGISLLSSLLFEQGSIAVIILALFGKLLIGSAYALIYLYATELFPTLLRAYGLGTASMVGRLGSIAAPFVVDLMGKENRIYPTLVFGGFALLSGVLSLLLPETLKKHLPDTIRDVEVK